jgi:hypothetical protein
MHYITASGSAKLARPVLLCAVADELVRPVPKTSQASLPTGFSLN